ncbi:hypothetical protein EYF80_047323 [Liparis tanakae]|uniref:Uncharacterized protein n=1 Tax=Liparis tanakae TaxID=230148 RepID=A0A4Z2FMZ1_9TELE|nr:hypothetical protein EYF80_047323 [Liparis tanakae]
MGRGGLGVRVRVLGSRRASLLLSLRRRGGQQEGGGGRGSLRGRLWLDALSSPRAFCLCLEEQEITRSEQLQARGASQPPAQLLAVLKDGGGAGLARAACPKENLSRYTQQNEKEKKKSAKLREVPRSRPRGNIDIQIRAGGRGGAQTAERQRPQRARRGSASTPTFVHHVPHLHFDHIIGG